MLTGRTKPKKTAIYIILSGGIDTVIKKTHTNRVLGRGVPVSRVASFRSRQRFEGKE